MVNGDDVILDDNAKEAVHAARNAAHAVEVARQVQIETAAEVAAQKAADLAAQQIGQKIVDENRMAKIMREQVEMVLAGGTEQEKSVILARVPYICQDVREIRMALQEISKQMGQRSLDFALLQQQSTLTNRIVYGLISIIVVGFMASVSMGVFK